MILRFINKQINDILTGDFSIISNKIRLLTTNIFNLIISIPFYINAFFFVLIIRLIEPIILIRIGPLISSRIGHYAGNTELYLCEKDKAINVPDQRYIDVFFNNYYPICNDFLKNKISNLINVYPRFFLKPIYNTNKLFFNHEKFDVGNNSSHDRDINNLLDESRVHLKFTEKELSFGEYLLDEIGIPKNSKIVCLLVRDSSYLLKKFGKGYNYHDFRDCKISNFLEAALELSKLGYYVVRMGEHVKDEFKTNNPRIIDYAKSAKRSPFLDIYLGYRCEFSISTSSGWDAVPSHLFKKPIVYVNYAPVAKLSTFSKKFILTTKKYYCNKYQKVLTYKEIFSRNVSLLSVASDYKKNNLELIENSPKEIKDAVIDMHNLINNKLILTKKDKELQTKFWKNFPRNIRDNYYKGNRLHGKIKAIMSPSFLKNNYNLMN